MILGERRIVGRIGDVKAAIDETLPHGLRRNSRAEKRQPFAFGQEAQGVDVTQELPAVGRRIVWVMSWHYRKA